MLHWEAQAGFREEMPIDCRVLDGLSVGSAVLILTFIADVFPLIGSFVKGRIKPMPA